MNESDGVVSESEERLRAALDTERARIVTFVRALISEATKPTGRRLDAYWLDEVIADLTPDEEAEGT